MTRALHILLDQYRVIAKAVDCLTLAGGQRRGEVFRLVHSPHAFTATARTGLDQHRVADGIRLALKQGCVLSRAVVARHQRHTGVAHQTLGLRLEPHRFDGRGRWANENQARIGTRLGELLVLAQKPIARVYCLCARGFGSGENARPLQVAVFGGATADVYGLVAHLDVLGVGISIRVNRNGFYAHACAGGRDAAGDLAAVGNEDFFEHRALFFV